MYKAVRLLYGHPYAENSFRSRRYSPSLASFRYHNWFVVPVAALLAICSPHARLSAVHPIRFGSLRSHVPCGLHWLQSAWLGRSIHVLYRLISRLSTHRLRESGRSHHQKIQHAKPAHLLRLEISRRHPPAPENVPVENRYHCVQIGYRSSLLIIDPETSPSRHAKKPLAGHIRSVNPNQKYTTQKPQRSHRCVLTKS